MGDVVKMFADPKDAIRAALKEDLKTAVVIGETTDGAVYFSTTSGDIPLINWLLDIAKQEVMRQSLP